MHIHIIGKYYGWSPNDKFISKFFTWEVKNDANPADIYGHLSGKYTLHQPTLITQGF